MGNAVKTLGQVSAGASIVPGVGQAVGIIGGAIATLGSLLSGKDKTKNTPGANDYIRSINTPDGAGTDWLAHRVIGSAEMLSWMQSQPAIGWLPVTNPDSYLKPPTVPMYLLKDGSLSMSPDSFVPFTGQAQTPAGGQAAIDAIVRELGTVDTIFVTNAKANAGKLIPANVPAYVAAVPAAAAATGSAGPLEAGAAMLGSTGGIVLLVVLLGGAFLLFRGSHN